MTMMMIWVLSLSHSENGKIDTVNRRRCLWGMEARAFSEFWTRRHAMERASPELCQITIHVVTTNFFNCFCFRAPWPEALHNLPRTRPVANKFFWLLDVFYQPKIRPNALSSWGSAPDPRRPWYRPSLITVLINFGIFSLLSVINIYILMHWHCFISFFAVLSVHHTTRNKLPVLWLIRYSSLHVLCRAVCAVVVCLICLSFCVCVCVCHTPVMYQNG